MSDQGLRASMTPPTYGPFTTPEGIVVEFVGAKMHLSYPPGMSLPEVLARVQPYFDRANQATGEDIQMVLPEEAPPL